jgi:hypothetical protein
MPREPPEMNKVFPLSDIDAILPWKDANVAFGLHRMQALFGAIKVTLRCSSTWDSAQVYPHP